MIHVGVRDLKNHLSRYEAGSKPAKRPRIS